jgi:hypothetical protein
VEILPVPQAPLAKTATWRPLAARFWQSLSQGTFAVDLALFLHALGWRGASIGLVLSGAALNLLVGITTDRLRRKPFLIPYERLTCVCALLADGLAVGLAGPLNGLQFRETLHGGSFRNKP